MKKIIALSFLLTASVFAVGAVELTCKAPKTDGEVPRFASKLAKYMGKEISLRITRNSISLKSEGMDTVKGKARGSLPTEHFLLSGLGDEVGIILTSAGPYLGAKTSRVLFHSENVKVRGKKLLDPDEKRTFQIELKCTNDNAGEQADFINLCTEAPRFDGELSCKVRHDSEVPNFKLASSKKGIDLSIEEESNQRVVNMKFRPNDEPATNSKIQYLEYCFFYQEKDDMDELFQNLRVSPKLANNGVGIASVESRGSDGGASIVFDCK